MDNPSSGSEHIYSTISDEPEQSAPQPHVVSTQKINQSPASIISVTSSKSNAAPVKLPDLPRRVVTATSSPLKTTTTTTISPSSEEACYESPVIDGAEPSKKVVPPSTTVPHQNMTATSTKFTAKHTDNGSTTLHRETSTTTPATPTAPEPQRKASGSSKPQVNVQQKAAVYSSSGSLHNPQQFVSRVSFSSFFITFTVLFPANMRRWPNVGSTVGPTS